MSLHIVILAAGSGKRMFSDTPKVLHNIAGKPMLLHVIDAAFKLTKKNIHVIVGFEAEKIKNSLSSIDVNWVMQNEQLGTGHALMQALPQIPDDSQVVVLSADVPLITHETIKKLIDETHKTEDTNVLALLLAKVDCPYGMGRVMRNEEGKIYSIVEEKDANENERLINEIYTGMCCASAKDLKRWLPQLNSNNMQKEYYLTDIIKMAVSENIPLSSHMAEDLMEVKGVNNRLQLQQLERIWQQKNAEKLLLQGVNIVDSARIDIRGELICGKDVFIDINNLFTGKVSLGNNSKIGPNCVLSDVVIGNNVEILPNSVLEGCIIADNCKIGPFARLRNGTKLSSNCKIGNFVETKEAIFGNGTKASHLSYLGDVVIGNDTNIGAGTITCNYDGINKNKTDIGDNVFIGSGTELVAPINIGSNATIGAGSTVRKNVPSNELTLNVTTQKTIKGWSRPKKHTPEE